jgi:hypothetical protein
MITREPSLRMSGAAPPPEKRRLSRPAPPSPRLKSMLETLMAPGRFFDGSRLGAGAVAAVCAMSMRAPWAASTAPIAAKSPMASPMAPARR